MFDSNRNYSGGDKSGIGGVAGLKFRNRANSRFVRSMLGTANTHNTNAQAPLAHARINAGDDNDADAGM
jgi:hypothetical protein